MTFKQDICYNYWKQTYYLRSFMNSCTAIIPYTQPVDPEEFIRREAEKARAQSVSLALQPFSPIGSEIDAVSSLFIRSIESFNGKVKLILMGEKFSSSMITLEFTPFLFESSTRVASAAKLDGDKIAEALQSELAITTADDARPIVATYGCGPCVAVGGYDATNKIAFVVHFANSREITASGGLIFWNISKLVKTPISSPIQLHLRGGHEGQSEAIVEAIKLWMTWWEKDGLPMEIASEDILTSGMEMGGKSLSIDSRTGKVSEYSPMSNAKSRDFSELDVMRAMMSAFEPKITLAYSPK